MTKEVKVAIIGGIAIIIGAVISYFAATEPVRLAIEATKTAEAVQKLTSTATTSNEQVVLRYTVTSTPSPMPLPTATNTPMLPTPVPPPDTPMPPTDTPIPPTPVPPTSHPTPTSDFVPTKCETIKATFPQSLEDVRTKFQLPANERNFRLVYEECGAVATGFIFEGNTEFELSVPEGGCIDSYSGAYFSEQPVSHSFGGLRVYRGIVRATGMTYRVAWCETKQ